MKNVLKLGAVVLALVMVLSMGVTAFASGNTASSASTASNSYAHLDDNTFDINKEIVLFNVDESEIFEPNVVFTYTVAPVDVTDGAPTVTGHVLGDATKTTTAVVKDGVANAVTIQGHKVNAITGTNGAGATVSGASGATTTITFGGDNGTKVATLDEGTTITASNAGGTNGKVAKGYLTVTVDAAAIYTANKGPGIYRYKISDTTADATLTAAGIQRDANYVKDLYLDVYVKNNTNNPVDGYVVYGYVLFKEGNTADANKDLDIEYGDSVATETVKVDGFTVLSETTSADQYHTYNVQVTKTTTGDLADKRNNFPFSVTLANSTINSQDDFYYVVTTDGSAATAVTTYLAADGSWSLGDTTTTPASSVLKFQDGDGILITGLPLGTTIDVTEYNNTYDVYKASAKDESDTALNLDSGSTTDAVSVNVAHEATASLHAVKTLITGPLRI